MATVQQFERLGAAQARNYLPRSSSSPDILVFEDERRRVAFGGARGGSVAPFDVYRNNALHKRAEDKLRENDLVLRQLAETLPAMIWSATADGQIDHCNGRMLEYIGGSPEASSGICWTSFIHPDDADQATQAWMDCLATGSAFRVEARAWRAADQCYRWCVASANPLRDKLGAIVKWCGVIEESREPKPVEPTPRLTTMAELTASIAHEVCQPLASIILNGETGLRRLARPEPDNDAVRRLTERMVADARRASEILDRIRATASRKTPALTPLSLNAVIEESMALLRHDLEVKNVTVSLNLAPGLPAVMGDRVQLQQVIVNLAMNAVQAMAQTADGRRRIAIRTALSSAKTVTCSVDDSGPGVDPGHLPHLFDSFFTTKATGMGMGLPICRSIVEAHRGQIRADQSAALGGARFSFALPAPSKA